MKKIFILGATGFVGRRLTEKLGASLTGKVIGYSSHDCDLLDLKSIRKSLGCVQKQDIIVVASSITRLKENSFQAMIKNIEMTENLCLFLRESPVAQVIFLSTVDVYGLLQDATTIQEDILPAPNDCYSLSKITSEYLLRKNLVEHDIALTIFRLTGIYGRGDEGKSTINALARSAKDNGFITILGDGADLRDFVFVDDLCRLVAMAIRKQESLTCNVATGKSYPIIEIAKTICYFFGAGCSLKFKASNSVEKRAKHMVYDVALLNKFFPDMEFTRLENGIKEYLGC